MSARLWTFGSATVARPGVTVGSSYRSTTNHRVLDNGNTVLEGLRIFKAGTFRDSMGEQRTWDDDHVDQMVSHFTALRASGKLENVPVREDHSFRVANVIGYFSDLYRDRQDPSFLACDIEFTEPGAFGKWQRGTYRGRSIEVGMYQANDEAVYFPVVMGLAFVDIPAVEGLFGRSTTPSRFSQTIVEEENDAMTIEQWTAAANYAQALTDWTTAANYAKSLDDWSRAVTYAQAVNEEATRALGGNGTGANQPPVVTTFRVEGQAVADYARVQTHIDGLEQFRVETITTGREAFIDTLVSDRKITGPQGAAFKAMVQDFNDRQWTTWQAAYEAAPPSPALGQQVGPSSVGPTPATGGFTQPDVLDERSQLEEIVKNHQRSGLPQEQLEKLASYQRLVALRAATGQTA